jgi:lipopolysaccharide transport system ATP-binding protein
MSATVIWVENLAKAYRIGLREIQPQSLQEALLRGLRAPFRYLLTMSRPPSEAETLWSLRDVSFEVQQGEVLGIIGSNGSGKSTLLKILSRITEPTAGRAMIQGRVRSLLEVGTGFHPELTGRENIYLNGAIMGMKRREIDSKFEVIMGFAEVGNMIDTPVKRYSSGMYVRLAFAVAAHLEPEILIVDEVLAVGDAAFQRKSLGRMDSMANSGRTVIFVSHSMPTVQALCQRVIWLDKGRIMAMGNADEVVEKYLKTAHDPAVTASVDLTQHPNRVTAPEGSIFRGLRLLDATGLVTTVFKMGEPITFEIELDTGARTFTNPLVFIGIDRRNVRICNLPTTYMVSESVTVTGRTVLRCVWRQDWLSPGGYDLAVLSFKERQGASRLDQIHSVVQFEILARDVYGTGAPPHETGVLIPNGHWEFQRAQIPASVVL